MSDIEKIVVDGNEVFDFINFVLKNKDKNDIEFRSCDFLKEDILKLSNAREYERIAFIDCSFEDCTLIQNIKTKSLSFTNNRVNNYEFIYNMSFLENLTVVGGNVDVFIFNNLNKLQYLRLSHSYVDNIEKYISTNLKYLFIDNTNIKDLSFINNFVNLEILSISEDQRLYNKELIEKISGRVKVIYDSIIEMDVYPND